MYKIEKIVWRKIKNEKDYRNVGGNCENRMQKRTKEAFSRMKFVKEVQEQDLDERTVVQLFPVIRRGR